MTTVGKFEIQELTLWRGEHMRREWGKGGEDERAGHRQGREDGRGGGGDWGSCVS
jgi:hypothetical protein